MNKAKTATALQTFLILFVSYIIGLAFCSPPEPFIIMLIIGFIYLIGLTVLLFIFYLLVFTLHKFNKKRLKKG